AGPEHAAPGTLVFGGDAAGAEIALVADIDDQIRVGTNEGQLACDAFLDQRTVGFHRVIDLIDKAGTDNGLGFGERYAGARQTGEQHAVPAGRADAMQAPVALLRDVTERDIAGADDSIPGVAARAGPVEYALDTGRRHRRIGDQDDRAALAAEARQCVAGLGISRAALVHHAPDIAEERLIACQA